MTTITNVYESLMTPLNLRNHQMDVACYAECLIQNQHLNVNRDNAIAAALLHDIGNIVKFVENDGEMGNLKNAYVQILNTTSDHKATSIILSKLTCPPEIIEIVNFKIFDADFIEKSSLEQKIVAYADLHISRDGLTTIEKRLEYIFDRYRNQKTIADKKSRDIYLRNIERLELLFSKPHITQLDLQDASKEVLILDIPVKIINLFKI